MEPRCRLQFIANAVNQLVGPRVRLRAVHGVLELRLNRRLDGQVDLVGFLLDVDDFHQCLAEVGRRHAHPHRMHVRAHQVPIAQVDPGRGDRARDHLAGSSEVVLVVRAAARAVRVHQRRLAATAGPSAALRIVGRGRRHVAHVDHVQLRNVDAQLHRRRTEQQRQLRAAEPVLALFTIVARDLRRVLPRLEQCLEVDEALVALHEVVIRLGRNFADIEQPRAVHRPHRPVACDPVQRIRVDLVARDLTAPHLLNDAVTPQRLEQEPDDALDIRSLELLAGHDKRLQLAPDVLAVTAQSRDEQVIPIARRA